MLNTKCEIVEKKITVTRLTKDSFSTEHSKILADIMIAAWRSAFRSTLPNNIMEQYTQREGCISMFFQILESGIGSMYLAQQDNQPMGLLYWLPETEDTVRIEALLTIPEAWGKGVGAALMEQALTDIRAAGHTTVRVMPFAENHRAQRFYRKFGFSATGNSHQGDALELEYVLKLI